MFCPQCGTEIPTNTNECPSCGTEFYHLIAWRLPDGTSGACSAVEPSEAALDGELGGEGAFAEREEASVDVGRDFGTEVSESASLEAGGANSELASEDLTICDSRELLTDGIYDVEEGESAESGEGGWTSWKVPPKADSSSDEGCNESGPSDDETTIFEEYDYDSTTVLGSGSGEVGDTVVYGVETAEKTLQLRLSDGRTIAVLAFPAIIGRSSDAAISLQNPTVSSYHARLLHDDGAYAIEDLASSNKTFVAGYESKTGSPTMLADGDEIKLGNEVMYVRLA